MSGAPRELPLPALSAVLLRSRAEALSAFRAAGWRPWATPLGLDAERRRLLNVDLTEPEVAYGAADDPIAVAHVEADRAGEVTHLELVGAEPVRPEALALRLLGEGGDAVVSGGADARQWVWGPESGAGARVAGVPVRLWVCAERRYGDRLWAVVTVVRR